MNDKLSASDYSLHHLQNVLLDMMKELDELCKKHNIKYYLNGGNALGAVRHKGFIPWDDDFDIMLLHDDYKRLIEVSRKELDPERWSIQEGGVDWPGCHSKLRLKKTFMEDAGDWAGLADEDKGIFIDIFEIVEAPPSKFARRIQYAAAKLIIAHSLLKRGYKSESLLKKLALGASSLLSYSPIEKLCRNAIYRYSGKNTGYVGSFFGMSRFRNAFYEACIFSEPVYAAYEDTMLPLPTDVDKYLTLTFGDYMKLPPEDQRHPAHAMRIDFGPY